MSTLWYGNKGSKQYLLVKGKLYSPVYRGPKWPFGKSGVYQKSVCRLFSIIVILLYGAEVWQSRPTIFCQSVLVPNKNMHKNPLISLSNNLAMILIFVVFWSGFGEGSYSHNWYATSSLEYYGHWLNRPCRQIAFPCCRAVQAVK